MARDILYRINGGALALLENQTSPVNIAASAGQTVEVWMSETKQTQSIVASGYPEVTSWDFAQGYGASVNVTIGTTAATDQIFIFVCCNTTAPTAPNFDLVGGANALSNNAVYALRWNGGGTRPNGSTVTLTFSSATNYAAAGVVVNGTATGTAATLTEGGGTTATAPTATIAANSTVFYLAAFESDGVEHIITSPNDAPAIGADTLPTAKIHRTLTKVGTRHAVVFTNTAASAGNSPLGEMTTSFTGPGWVVFGVS